MAKNISKNSIGLNIISMLSLDAKTRNSQPLIIDFVITTNPKLRGTLTCGIQITQGWLNSIYVGRF